MSKTQKKAYQRVEKFDKDDGMFEDTNQEDDSRIWKRLALTILRDIEAKNWKRGCHTQYKRWEIIEPNMGREACKDGENFWIHSKQGKEHVLNLTSSLSLCSGWDLQYGQFGTQTSSSSSLCIPEWISYFWICFCWLWVSTFALVFSSG